MEGIEDSGIESDNRPLTNGSAVTEKAQTEDSPVKSSSYDNLTEISLHNGTATATATSNNTYVTPTSKTAELQRKLADKHQEAARRAQRLSSAIVDQQPKKGSLLSRNRAPKYSKLMVPVKQSNLSGDQRPLVMLDSDESDEEFNLFTSHPNPDIAQQLIRDGYDLDLAPDDEDLDLIPPRPLAERCTCCQYPMNGCTIQ